MEFVTDWVMSSSKGLFICFHSSHVPGTVEINLSITAPCHGDYYHVPTLCTNKKMKVCVCDLLERWTSHHLALSPAPLRRN